MTRRLARHESLLTAGLCLAFFLYVDAGAYRQDLGLLVVTYALLALGMYVPLALCGSLSLAYNAYFAIGAYSVAILANTAPQYTLLAIPLALVVSMATGAILAIVTRRLSGFHLAVATMMFGIAVHTWLVNSEGLTGGAAGIGNIARPAVFGIALGRSAILGVGIALIWAIATAIARLRRSSLGIAMRAQRESIIAASTCGVPTASVKVLALAVGAGIATFAGVLLSYMNQFVLPDSFPIRVVFLVLFMPILGGLLTPWGAVVGAILVVFFTLGFDFFQGPGGLTFGLLTLFVLLVFPSGALGSVALLRSQPAMPRKISGGGFDR